MEHPLAKVLIWNYTRLAVHVLLNLRPFPHALAAARSGRRENSALNPIVERAFANAQVLAQRRGVLPRGRIWEGLCRHLFSIVEGETKISP